MSRFGRQSSRSPFRSPPRLYDTQRDAIIEEEIRLKSALKADAENRRIHDQLAMLQIKVRQTNELEDRVESLLRQNNQLARDNDELSRLLNEKKYEIQRLRAVSSEQNEREVIKNGQLYEVNKALELEIQLLKKERIESNRLYETHIDKLERMLDQKVAELDSMTLKCSDFSKELELTTIRFEEEKNKLKNLMTRTEHELERELEYTKERTTSEKFSEIDSMKRNHAAQVSILEEEISKLKILNNAKSDQFESQLAQNRALRKRHEEEMRSLALENDELRERMLKLEELNRSEVQTISIKYNNYHHEGTNNLKEQHGREIKLLLDEIDKLKWLIAEKNNEIQTLVQEKREMRKYLDETQLQLSSEIESLKNKIYSQQQNFAEENIANMTRINSLCDQLNRESEAYHARAKDFGNKINKLQAEVDDKQNQIEKIKGQAKIREKELQRALNETQTALQKTSRDLNESELERKSVEERFADHKNKAEGEIAAISVQLNKVQVQLEQTSEKLERQIESSSGSDDLLKIQIESLRQNISLLEEKAAEERQSHKSEMQELSSNINEKVKSLQVAHRRSQEELEKIKNDQIEILRSRNNKLISDKKYAQEEVKRYVEMYGTLDKYFKDPHEGALFDEKSKNSIYQVLSQVSQSSIHIF